MTRLGRISAALAAAALALMLWHSHAVLIPEAGGLTPFDSRVPGYSPEEAGAYLAALSDRGRAFYLLEMRWLDTLFPVAFSVAAGAGLMALAKGWAGWTRLALLAPVAGYLAVDLAENALVADLLRAGMTGFDPVTAIRASQFTVTKYALLGTIALTIMMLWRRQGRASRTRS
ncbi:hypothetical protein [Aestuariicoccus sp. MJ-SS9]|uniref:hypothetical protein n=1 Tax=Aestuariicoccus sp. MJ-SS9 TaxID=3079855 RepID=UPI0029090C8B|nr:hypothetical protein [Aestuariicoccus sp. MJ-SS9]MDU8910382.1 hypothetical protein [Aestuariicoccus sp. MJ-SS9]